MSDDEARELGPEMKAEGWYVIGGDGLLWCHEPSHRTVSVDGPLPRRTEYVEGVSGNYDCTAIVALHGEPADQRTLGYIVACQVRDDGGCPIEGNEFWVESYGEALKFARKIRQTVLDDRPLPTTSEQLEMFGG
jgi:hypothetical protein